MNAWEIDPNLQLSVYAEIGTRLILFFNKLGNLYGRVRAVLTRQLQQLAALPDAREISSHDEIDRIHKAASAVTGSKNFRIANFR